METEAERIAWEKFVQSHIAHVGHDVAGQGSPITEIVLEHYEGRYRALFEKIRESSPSSL